MINENKLKQSNSILVVGDCFYESTVVSSKLFESLKYDIDFIPKIYDSYGGAAVGVSMLLAQIGKTVYIKTYLGNDKTSLVFKKKLRKKRINTKGIMHFDGQTPRCINITCKGSRKIFLDQTKVPNNIPSELLVINWFKKSNSKYLYMTCPPWAKNIAYLAKKNDIFIVTDIQADFDEKYHNDFILCSNIVLLSANIIGINKAKNIMEKLYRKYKIKTIATIGINGCYAIGINGHEIIYFPQQNKVKNPNYSGLGAGDAFGAGLISAISENKSLYQAINRGQIFAENMLKTDYYRLNIKNLNINNYR